MRFIIASSYELLVVEAKITFVRLRVAVIRNTQTERQKNIYIYKSFSLDFNILYIYYTILYYIITIYIILYIYICIII